MKESELGDVVLVDADKNFVSTEYDDLEDLPDEIVSSFFICMPYMKKRCTSGFLFAQCKSCSQFLIIIKKILRGHLNFFFADS